MEKYDEMKRIYTHRFRHKASALFVLIWLSSTSLSLIAISTTFLWQYMQGQEDNIAPVILVIILAPCMLIMGMTFYNMYPNIQPLKEGLRIRILPFWWKTVLWEDIIDIKLILPFIPIYYAIVINKLTLIHRILGFIYIAGLLHGFKPIIYIGPMNDRDELIAIIRKNIDK